MPGNDAIAAFEAALPFCACSSHCGTGSGNTNSSSAFAVSVADNSFCACGVAQRILPCAADRQQIAAGDVERGAGALRHPRVGEVNPDAGDHLLDHDRLCHVVDTAGFQPAHDVLGFGQPRHEDDRHIGKARVAL